VSCVIGSCEINHYFSDNKQPLFHYTTLRN